MQDRQGTFEGVGKVAGRNGLAFRQVGERLFPFHPGKIIAWSRFLLAGIALLAIYIDPAQPTRYGAVTYAVLVAYVLYSALRAWAPDDWLGGDAGALVRHAVDVAVFAVLVHLTDGPTSPLFVFFTFAIIAGAMRWGWEGAVGTTAVLVVVFATTGYQEFADPEGDITRVVIRGAYLLVAGVLLGYFGAYRQRSMNRLARLAAWPEAHQKPGDRPALGASLRHASLVLGADRILVVWRERAGLQWHASHWDGQDEGLDRWAGAGDPPLVAPEFSEATFMTADPLGPSATTAEGRRRAAGPLVSAALVEDFGIGSCASAAFSSAHFEGRVFIIRPPALTPDVLSLTEIVARRIGIEFEDFGLRTELAAAEAIRARERLARDMHDSILQDLTASGLQLKSIEVAASADAKPAIGEAVRMLGEQQRRLRQFVRSANPKPAPARDEPLKTALAPVLAHLGGQWRCAIGCTVTPEDLRLSAKTVDAIRFVLAEAVANAVRHGAADEVTIEIGRGEGLGIVVRDNGKGSRAVAGTPGEGGQAMPFSIHQRVREFGGSCRLELRPSGAELTIALPEAG